VGTADNVDGGGVMEQVTQILIAVFASTGFWAAVTALIQARRDRKTANAEKVRTLEAGVRGLLHEKLIERCQYYINRGSITEGEFRDLEEYIYNPYKGLNGNGTGDAFMERCQELLFEKGE
jgi:hypothetical protein